MKPTESGQNTLIYPDQVGNLGVHIGIGQLGPLNATINVKGV